MRRPGWTDWPAENARRSYSDEEQSVKPGVARRDGAIANVRVHASSMPQSLANDQRFSDMVGDSRNAASKGGGSPEGLPHGAASPQTCEYRQSVFVAHILVHAVSALALTRCWLDDKRSHEYTQECVRHKKSSRPSKIVR